MAVAALLLSVISLDLDKDPYGDCSGLRILDKDPDGDWRLLGSGRSSSSSPESAEQTELQLSSATETSVTDPLSVSDSSSLVACLEAASANSLLMFSILEKM